MTQPQNYISPTELADVLVINRPQFSDERGFFREVFRQNDLEAALGRTLEFVQSNHARSDKGALRGIHVAPWSKLVTVTSGMVQAVIVDCRKNSPTFGRHVSLLLGDGHSGAIFVPPGCGNSYLVLSESADYSYLVTDYWAPGKEFGVRWNDPDLGIHWHTPNPLLSEKDTNNPLFKDITL